jgi:hypothetical protein
MASKNLVIFYAFILSNERDQRPVPQEGFEPDPAITTRIRQPSGLTKMF